MILSQDCATEEGQLQFLQEKAESDPDCYSPLVNSIGILTDKDPSPEELSTVSRWSVEPPAKAGNTTADVCTYIY